MDIVKVDSTNIDTLYQLNTKLAEDEGQAGLFTVSEGDYAQAFLAINPIMQGYLLYSEDTAIGFYIYHYKFATYIGKKVLYIEDAYVVTEQASDSNKQTLINHAITMSKQQDCCRVEMRMLKAFNIGYDVAKSCGFNPINKWQVYRIDL